MLTKQYELVVSVPQRFFFSATSMSAAKTRAYLILDKFPPVPNTVTGAETAVPYVLGIKEIPSDDSDKNQ